MRGDPIAINAAVARERDARTGAEDYPPECRLYDCEQCDHYTSVEDGAVECWSCGWVCPGCQSQWCATERPEVGR